MPSFTNPTRLYLIRHGEVSRSGYCNGQMDLPLTKRGVRQMRRVARLLRDVPIKAVYSSDLQRAIIGARLTAEVHGLRIKVCPELREKCFGRWEGLALGEIGRHFGKEWREWLSRPDRACPRGGESYNEVERRVFRVVRRILRTHKGIHVAIVSHGGVNRVVLCRALGLDLRYLFRIQQDYGSINIIDYQKDSTVIHLINGRSSLRSPLTTCV